MKLKLCYQPDLCNIWMKPFVDNVRCCDCNATPMMMLILIVTKMVMLILRMMIVVLMMLKGNIIIFLD